MSSSAGAPRAYPWAVCCLVALLVSVTPVGMWPDLVSSTQVWENWYWKGQPATRPVFSLQHLPPVLAVEISIFKALVVPPGMVARLFNGLGTEYALPWVNPGATTEMVATLPPLALAIQHLRWSVPFWMAVLLASYEGVRILRGRHARMA